MLKAKVVCKHTLLYSLRCFLTKGNHEGPLKTSDRQYLIKVVQRAWSLNNFKLNRSIAELKKNVADAVKNSQKLWWHHRGCVCRKFYKRKRI